jgi:hypothetical protein
MRWITALNLHQWADTVQARTAFPELVADLIRATVTSIADFRFPNGDKGQVRGFDGELDALGVAPYIPDEKSIWEFGVTDASSSKATSDYEKRTLQVDEATRKLTTFVFASPRVWDNPKEKRGDWVSAKRDLGQWKDVRYIDGAMFEDWLSACPAVAARWARNVLKVMPSTGARSTEEFWHEFATQFAPTLAEDVLLAGREEQAKQLLQGLSGGAERPAYSADSPDEVLAFAIAAIRKAEPATRFFFEARTLVVDTEDAARSLGGRTDLIFLPRGQARGLAGFLARSAPTIVSAGADEKRTNHVLLNRPSSSALGRAFVAMGLTEEEGYAIARRCGRSLAILARQRPSGTAVTPEWVERADALLPALFAGAWEATRNSDQSVVRTLAFDKEYEAVEAPLRKLAKLQDPPVDRLGDIWTMRSSVDAFVNLGHLIGPEHLKQFAAAAKTVFSFIPPMPNADDLFEAPSERQLGHSSWLREGMMTMLLHMAVLHEQADFSIPGSTPQRFVDDIVKGLPALSSDHRLIASLERNLALLAEAAPIPFLDALERLLEGDASAIRPLFDEQKGFINPRTYHTGLLWALETLAWDAGLLSRVALCLARLAEIDPGGSISNRPINSLREIFLTWRPHTAAPHKTRVAILTQIIQKVPAIAWPLLTKLLPKFHDTSNQTARPKLREFEAEAEEQLTYRLVWETQNAVVRLALAHVGDDVERWSTVIRAFSNFRPEAFEETCIQLRRVFAETSGVVRNDIWETLRKEANRHHAFPDAEWALDAAKLSRIDALVEEYRPNDPSLENTWLFDDWLPTTAKSFATEADPWAEIESSRLSALKAIAEQGGIGAIVALLHRVKLPHQAVGAIQGLHLSQDLFIELVRMTLASSEHLDFVVAALVVDGVSRYGDEFIEALRRAVDYLKLAPARVANILMGLPENGDTWALVETFGEDTNNSYWTRKQPVEVIGNKDVLLRALDNYTAKGRAISAMHAAARRLPDVPTASLIRLLDSGVREINASAKSVDTMTQYVVEQVFKELESRHDVEPIDVGRREFAYLSCLDQRKRPLVLHRLLAEQPTLFMEAICVVYKPSDEDVTQLTESDRQVAIASYELLSGIEVVPGQNGDDVDEIALLKWCEEVRRLAAEAKRSDVTDSRIGHLLAHAPASKIDFAWPHEAVRSAIELFASDELENGLMIERYNMRGVHAKAVGEGGTQERALATQSLEWAKAMPEFPRAAALMRRIAEGWTRDAEREDLQAAQRLLRD